MGLFAPERAAPEQPIHPQHPPHSPKTPTSQLGKRCCCLSSQCHVPRPTSHFGWPQSPRFLRSCRVAADSKASAQAEEADLQQVSTRVPASAFLTSVHAEVALRADCLNEAVGPANRTGRDEPREPRPNLSEWFSFPTRQQNPEPGWAGCQALNAPLFGPEPDFSP